MKFLFFSFEMPHLLMDSTEIAGGAAVQWLSWIRGFRESGHEFGLLTYKGAAQQINRKLDFDIVESYNLDDGIRKLRLFYKHLPSLYKAIKKYKPDYIIQASAKKQTFLLMLISKIQGISFIHRIASDVHVDEQISTLVEKRPDIILYRLGLKFSDFILAQNNYQFLRLKEKYPNKKILLIHNPFELETKKTDILTRDVRNYIAWIGNFRPIKNLPALACSARELPNINFKIAGKQHDTINKETIETLNELKQMKNVEFVGYLNRNDLKPFLANSIALLNTSFNEGFSNTFLEAWSLGVPVITTKNVNPDDIINKYEIGKVANDYNQIPEMITEIIKYNPSDFENLALRCYNYVKENHDPVMLVDKLVSFLQKNIGD